MTTHITASKPYVAESIRLSGDLAVWFFILAEVTVFAILFFCYCSMYYLKTDLFVESQQALHPIAGLINTIALISSSYFVAIAVIFAKQKQNHQVRWAILAAVLLSMLYVATKLWEYNILISDGYRLSTNTFFMFYFFITGFHFMHVLLGMFILLLVYCNLSHPEFLPNNLNTVESAASYWHMVDLVWVILFPLMYVI
ncbi:MAG: cytochrome c oxidase subunit 3 [Moritella sp.]|uniref:cytochrome c oxidase subunit 3 n=1 Tax=Moritella sp. TaxID=78556 RepID=UPI0029AA483F|nr:cytochrome c oxidase subunit 3 [Moritella sp.]MDX2319748.1 cytochrome c oxidase subunit 3 [Moritella sp.]